MKVSKDEVRKQLGTIRSVSRSRQAAGKTKEAGSKLGGILNLQRMI
jgi:hypothetical protein